MNENTMLCRICLKCLSTDTKHQMLKDLEDNVLECLTEIDLTIPANPLACEECVAAILSLYRFKQTCCATERLVQDLRSRSIPFEDALKYVDIDKVKPEVEVVNYNDININFTVDFNTEIPTVLQNNNAVASYTCFTCSSTFNSRRKILRHLKIHFKKCTKNNSTLNRHKKVHSELRPHKCDYCIYRARSTFHLIEHLRKHTGEKPYACHVCSYRTNERRLLKLHVYTHTKPYKCKICDYSSSEKRYLRNHMNMHRNERNFKCAKCKYGSHTKCMLIRHMRTHTGEKPYKCDKCSYSAAQSGRLAAHRKLHFSSSVLKCDSCDFKTLNISQLRNHKC